MTNRGSEQQRHAARRRGTIRPALAVIPDIAGLSVSLGSPLDAANNFNDVRDRVLSWYPPAGVASSPDEMVIRKRGRRSRTIIWSPEADSKRGSLLHYSSSDQTPDKMQDESQSSVVPREHMSMKKKLELSCDFDESQLTTPEKKKKFRNAQGQYKGHSLVRGLGGLSNDQLIKMLMELVSMQENGVISANDKLRDIIMEMMPIADIKPLQEKLHVLQRNVYGSLVSSNDFTYIRAHMHLDAFQRSLEGQGNILAESQHWVSLMQYVIAAWNITKDLPEFENGDKTAKNCFTKLIRFCKQALLNGDFSISNLDVFIIELETMARDCSDMKICLQMAKEMTQI